MQYKPGKLEIAFRIMVILNLLTIQSAPLIGAAQNYQSNKPTASANFDVAATESSIDVSMDWLAQYPAYSEGSFDPTSPYGEYPEKELPPGRSKTNAIDLQLTVQPDESVIKITARIQNNRTGAMPPGKFTDELPEGIEYISGPEEMTYHDGSRRLVMPMERLAAGASFEFEYVVQVTSSTPEVAWIHQSKITPGNSDNGSNQLAVAEVMYWVDESGAVASSQLDWVEDSGGWAEVGNMAVYFGGSSASHKMIEAKPERVSESGPPIQITLHAYGLAKLDKESANHAAQQKLAVSEKLADRFGDSTYLEVSFDEIGDLNNLPAGKEPYVTTFVPDLDIWVKVPIYHIDYENNFVLVKINHFSTWGAGLGDALPQNGAQVLLFDQPYTSLFTGSARYSVPIWTPPGRGGMQPGIALSYSSATVDGVLGDVQAPWVGVGWNMDAIEIVRKITTNPDGYGYVNEFALTLNGAVHELIQDETNPARYHTKRGSFLYVERHNYELDNAGLVPNATGEWWEVAATDGTRYRIGWNEDAEQLSLMQGYSCVGGKTCDLPEAPYDASGYAGIAEDLVAMRWRVDQIMDRHGNFIEYSYTEIEPDPVSLVPAFDRASYVDTIRYTGHMDTAGNVDVQPLYQVKFITEDRMGDVSPTTFGIWDHYDTQQLAEVQIGFLTYPAETFTVARKYQFNYENAIGTLVLDNMRVVGGDFTDPVSGTIFPFTEAATIEFSYAEDMDNRAVEGGSGDNVWTYPRLTQIDNGYEGSLVYTYLNDGRGTDSWYNYRVTNAKVYSQTGVQSAQQNYTYTTPVYSGIGGNDQLGGLIGHTYVTESSHNFTLSSDVLDVKHYFGTIDLDIGREYTTEMIDANTGTVYQKSRNSYVTDNSQAPFVGWNYRYLFQTESFIYNGSSGLILTSKSVSERDPGTGNLEVQFTYLGGNLSHYTTYRYNLNPDPNVYIMDRVSSTILRDAGGTIQGETAYQYDNTASPPYYGDLTLVQTRVNSGTSTTIDARYIYDVYGNVVETRNYRTPGTMGSVPGGDEYAASYVTYDSAYATFPVEARNSLNYTSTTAYHVALGVPYTVTDPNGYTSSSTFDGLGRPLTTMVPGIAQAAVKYSYPQVVAGKVAAPYSMEMEIYDDIHNTYRSVWGIYDGLGRILQTQTEAGSGQVLVTDVLFNALGQVEKQHLPYKASAPGTPGTMITPSWAANSYTSSTYDALGRAISVTAPGGISSSTTYKGLITEFTNPNGVKATRATDGFGRLKQVIEHNTNGSNYAVTNYTYDVRGGLTKVQDTLGNQTTMTYNWLGQKLSMNDPDMGAWSYEYFAMGTLDKQTDALGQEISFTYDDLNRLTAKADTTSTLSTYTYGASPGTLGLRTGMTDASGSASWTYSDFGRTVKETRIIDSVSGSYYMTSATDWLGRVETIDYNNEDTVSYDYDPLGRQIGANIGQTTLATLAYNELGQVATTFLPGDMVVENCYNAATNRMVGRRAYENEYPSCVISNPTDAVMDFSYGYDNNGNITTLDDNALGEYFNFTYDSLNRLTGAEGLSDTSFMAYRRTYQYDAVGNILAVNEFNVDPTTTGTLEEDYAGFWFYENWTNTTDSGASGGEFSETDTQDDGARFAFTGTEFTYVRPVGPDQGEVEVWVDGTLVTSVDNYAVSAQAQATVVVTVSAGEHWAEIKNKDADPVALDAIMIPAIPTETPTPTGTTPTPTGTTPTPTEPSPTPVSDLDDGNNLVVYNGKTGGLAAYNQPLYLETWLDSAWYYRIPVTVTKNGATDSDVLIALETDTLIAAGKMQADCDDIRITEADKLTALTYWIEGGCNTEYTQLWVSVPDLLVDGDTTIYLYYGNASASNAEIVWLEKFTAIIADDAASICPTDWERNVDLDDRFPVGASSYGTTGGDTQHDHAQVSCTTGGQGWVNARDRGSLNIARYNHSHTLYADPDPVATDQLPPYVEVLFCQSNDLDITPSIVAFYDSSVPANWTQLSALDSRFPLGSFSYGDTGGSTEHTHTWPETQTSTASSYQEGIVSGGKSVAAYLHRHTIPAGTTDSASSLPAYREMVYGEENGAGYVPEGAILIVSQLPPLGWSRFTALDNVFAMGSTSAGTTGGGGTHNHEVSIITNGAGAVGIAERADHTAVNSNTTHACTATTDDQTYLPPYLEVIYAQKKTLISSVSTGPEENAPIPPTPTATNTPAVNITIVPIAPKNDIILEATQPTFSWQGLSWASDYEIIVEDAGFGNETPYTVSADDAGCLGGGTCSWTITSALGDSHHYQWRIRGTDGGSFTSEWNTAELFYVFASATVTPTITPTETVASPVPTHTFTPTGPYATATAIPGVLGKWLLDGDAADTSGNGNNIYSLANGATYIDINNSPASLEGVALDGVNDFVKILDATALKPTSAFSLAVWVYTTSAADGSVHYLINKGDSSHDYALYVDDEGLIQFQMGDMTPNIVGGPELPPYTWTYIVGAYDSATDLMQLYVNGIMVASQSVTGTLSHNTNILRFGSDRYLYLAGWLDEVTLYDRALAPSEVADFYGQHTLPQPSATPTLAVTYTETVAPSSSPTITATPTLTVTPTVDLTLTFIPNPTLPADSVFGNGLDGDITISTTVNLSTDNLITGRSCADGGDMVTYNIIELASSSAQLHQTAAEGCLAAGDEVLIINVQGTDGRLDNVGNYEFKRILSTQGEMVVFSDVLQKSYGEQVGDNENIGIGDTDQRVLLIRVPNYHDLTVESSGILTAAAWDSTLSHQDWPRGEKGGILVFRVSGVLSGAGIIDMDDTGFMGGLGGAQTPSYSRLSASGESISGLGFEGYYVPNDGGGAAGPGSAGAGSHQTIGLGSYPGAILGEASLATILMGSGGGGTKAFQNTTYGGKGGRGGGIILISANTVNFSGNITAEGEPGHKGTGVSWYGADGAGGSIRIEANNLQLSGIVSAEGGPGGGGSHRAGGDGYIALYANTNTSYAIYAPAPYYGGSPVTQTPTPLVSATPNLSATPTPTPPGDMTQNLVSYWEMREVQDTRYDSWGTNHLTESSGDIYRAANGIQDEAIDFEKSSSQMLTLTSNSTLQLADDDFTISLWIKPETTNSGAVLVMKRTSETVGTEYRLLNSNGNIAFYIGKGSSSLAGVSLSNVVVSGQWTHVVVYHDISAKIIGLEVDGVVQETVYTGTPGISTAPFELGGATSTGSNFDGLMDEVAIWDRLLTSTERNWLYNSGAGRSFSEIENTNPDGTPTPTATVTLTPTLTATAPTDRTQGLISYWALDESSGTRYDSHSSNDLTDNNTVGVTIGKIDDAADFVASNAEYLSIPDNPSLSTGDIDFTWFGWVQFDTTQTNSNPRFAAKGKEGTTGYFEWQLVLVSATDKIFAGISSNGTTESGNMSSTNAITTGAPVFIAFVHDSTNDTIALYVNGTLTSQSYSSGSFDSSGAFTLGAHGEGGGNIDGWVDESGFYKSALSTEELDWLYNNGAGRSYSEIEASGATATPTPTVTNSPTPGATIESDSGWQANTYTYDASQPHAVSSVSRPGGTDAYTYDANGNMTGRVEDGVIYSHTYNTENRLETVKNNTENKTWTFTYDGDGNRIKQLNPDGTIDLFLFGGLYTVTDVNDTGADGKLTTKAYILGGQRIAIQEDSTLKYLITDHLGSTVAMLDSDGDLLADTVQRYYPFGAPRLTAANSPAFTYTGQRDHGNDFGLMDYKARFYSPRLGRFTQPDSIVPGMSSQSYNRYSYVNNNPIMMTDPSGHRPAGECGEGDSGKSCGGGTGCGPWNNYCKGKGAGGNGGTKGGNHANDPVEDDVSLTPPVTDPGRRDAGYKWWKDPAVIDKIAMDTQDIATAFSAAGAVGEVVLTGLGCLTGVAGCLGGAIKGVSVHAATTNKVENIFSLVSFGLTVYSDTLKGNTDLAQGKYGRDTKQSATSAFWGAVIPIGGLDFALDLYASAYNRGKVGTFEESIDFLNNALADAINSLIQGEP